MLLSNQTRIAEGVELIWGVVGVARWQNKFKYWGSTAFRFHAILSSPLLCRSTPFWAGKLKWSQTLGRRLLWSYRNTGKQAHIGNRRSNSVINTSFPGPSINCSMIRVEFVNEVVVHLSVSLQNWITQTGNLWFHSHVPYLSVCVPENSLTLCVSSNFIYLFIFFSGVSVYCLCTQMANLWVCDHEWNRSHCLGYIV